MPVSTVLLVTACEIEPPLTTKIKIKNAEKIERKDLKTFLPIIFTPEKVIYNVEKSTLLLFL